MMSDEEDFEGKFKFTIRSGDPNDFMDSLDSRASMLQRTQIFFLPPHQQCHRSFLCEGSWTTGSGSNGSTVEVLMYMALLGLKMLLT